MIKIQSLWLLLILFVGCQAPTEKTPETTNNLKVLASPSDSLSAEPYLFTDKNGVVYLSWIEKIKETSFLKFSSLNNDEWSKPRIIATGNNWFVNWADYPMLASDGGDNMIAHILEKSENGTYTYDVKTLSSSDKGNSWSSPRILHDDGKKAEHGFVSVIPHNENYFISWLDGRNTVMEGGAGHGDGHYGAMSLRAASIDKAGIKSDEWELDNRVCDCCQTTAALTSNGPVVIYRDRSEDEIRDISIVRLVKGQWTKPKPIFSDNWKISGCPVNGPRAEALGNTLAIAWFSSPDKIAKVQVTFSGDGGATFNTPIKINEGETIGRVDLIMLDDESAMVSWMEGSQIKAARVYTDGRKDPAITIASSTESRSGGFPQMTKSGDRLIFAWSDTKEKTIKTASLKF
ncbi:MAG: sialidase family protein [Bacteroidota bacterium]